MDKRVSACLLKLRREHPFLATLSLHLDYAFTERVAHIDTDGMNTRINPVYFAQLSTEQRIGTVLHVTLHCALLHTTRCGNRIRLVWNTAADIVVNEIIAEGRFQPPPNTAIESRYAGLSVEQVYTRLLASLERLAQNARGNGGSGQPGPAPSATQDQTSACMTGTANTPCAQPSNAGEKQLTDLLQALYPSVADLAAQPSADAPNAKAQRMKVETHWKRALTRAQVVDRMSAKNQGDLPAGLLREIDQVLNPQLDWRTLLWRFMAKTPCDFNGFDRRFFHQGLYLDQLEGEALKVYVALDTSGSITERELAQFRAEVETIVRCYQNIEAQLYFVDVGVYGPYPLTQATRIVRAEGGGGTDFSEFFAELEPGLDPFSPALCVYLTDGFGEFPETEPTLPVLWVVSNDGSDHYPFGEVARLGS